MKTFNQLPKRFFQFIFPLGFMILGVSSCTVSQTATRTNDGIYYDPSQEPAQEPVRIENGAQNGGKQTSSNYNEPIRIGGKYFDDNGNAPVYDEQELSINNQNRVVLKTHHNDDYIEWGDEGRTEININNNYYGSGFYSPIYSPYDGNQFSFWGSYGLGFGFGFNSFYGNAYYPNFYNPFYPYYRPVFGYPYYGYGSFYNPYYPYNGYYPHNFYQNPYVRKVTRGRGNNNGVTTTPNRNANMNRVNTAEGIRRSDKVYQETRTNNAHQRSSMEQNSSRRSTDKVRIRQSSPMPNNQSSQRTYTRPSTTPPTKVTPRRRTDKVPVIRQNSTQSSQGTFDSGVRQSSPVYRSGTSGSTIRRGGIRRN